MQLQAQIERKTTLFILILQKLKIYVWYHYNSLYIFFNSLVYYSHVMQHSTHYTLITFYKFVDIANPIAEVKEHLKFCKDIGMKWRIYIGEEGISATATCNNGQLQAYKLYLQQNKYFFDVENQINEKSSPVKSHMFDKMIVKYRQEIVALGKTIDQVSFERSLQELTDDELKAVIDGNNPDWVILDMRNSYEYKLWHFKNAIPAGTINFREVETLLEDYKQQFADKKVLMYCTGWIRCDKLSVLLKENGVDNFYGLQGGIVKYVNKHNDGNRLGNLYTFDGVISKKVGDANTHTTIGTCIYSGLQTNNCENCRYSPCNARIIARRKQYKRFGWFCSLECFTKAQQDGLVKNDAFDNFDYKSLRRDVKNHNLWHDRFIQMVQEHLDTTILDKNYSHATSQKEEIVDKEYLTQWMNQHQRTQ